MCRVNSGPTCLFYVPCQFRPFLLLLRVLKFVCVPPATKKLGGGVGEVILRSFCRTLKWSRSCRPDLNRTVIRLMEVYSGLLLYYMMYATVPPFWSTDEKKYTSLDRQPRALLVLVRALHHEPEVPDPGDAGEKFPVEGGIARLCRRQLL